MMIHVLKSNGSYDYLKPEALDRYIEQRKIISFKRQDGVCLIGVDPIREDRDEFYLGAERRRQRTRASATL